MKYRGLARLFATLSVATIALVAAAAPAVAEEHDEPAGAALLNPAHAGRAANFATKGCVGIPGGAKANLDGWVFDQPVRGATEVLYVVGFDNGGAEPVWIGIAREGVTGLKITQTPAELRRRAESIADAPPPAAAPEAPAAPPADPAPAAPPADPAPPAPAADPADDFDFEPIPLPAGVAAGLMSGGGAWVQTPAGWTLLTGLVFHDVEGSTVTTFSLVRACVATGGPMLPVTGANAPMIAGGGVALVGAGVVALFLLRRRRQAVTFVA